MPPRTTWRAAVHTKRQATRQEAMQDTGAIFGSENEEERKKNSGNYQKREYEAIKYVGLSKEHPTIVRFVGNFVAEDLKAHRPNPTDMKFMHISKVKSDDGKNTFYLYLPLRSDEPEQDHLMWKIIDKVYAKDWVKDPATNKNKSI